MDVKLRSNDDAPAAPAALGFAGWLVRTRRAQVVLALAGAVAFFGAPFVIDRFMAAGEAREAMRLAVLALWLGATLVALARSLGGPRARRAAKSPAARAAETRPAGAADTPSPGSETTRIESPPASPSGDSVAPAAGVAPRRDGPAGEASAAQVGPGGRYQITRELGRGGMGVVYHAIDTVLQREVALKELPLQLGGATDLAQRFRQEARVLAKLSHPAIVQVHDLIEDAGRLWIALEYVRGGTLADAMRYGGGSLGWLEVARIGRQVAEGLAFAHERGVIHRDIKPMNVLVTDAHPPVAKLTDFGLARLVESTEHTQPGSLLGSARYMSPEQVTGHPADARSDLYALGITFFEMLAGRVPFEGEFAAVLARHVNEAPPDVRSLAPDAPPRLAALVASLLAKAPGDRPHDAWVVARELEAVSGEDSARRAA